MKNKQRFNYKTGKLYRSLIPMYGWSVVDGCQAAATDKNLNFEKVGTIFLFIEIEQWEQFPNYFTFLGPRGYKVSFYNPPLGIEMEAVVENNNNDF